MSGSERLIYESPNGDAWYLIRMKSSDAVWIRHEPNGPSGGRPKLIPIGEFLAPGNQGPEHQELLRMIGSLIDQISPEDEAKITEELG